jgi:hypothetical protein
VIELHHARLQKVMKSKRLGAATITTQGRSMQQQNSQKRSLRVAALATVFALFGGSNAFSATAIDWDRIENVKQAAVKIGEIQSRQGAEQAYKFIAACYKTHGLASAYSRAFESCIAQDFMVTQAMALVYEKVDPAALQKMRAPTRDQLQAALNQRVNGAYATYQMQGSEGLALKDIVDQHGMPVFFTYVFPTKDGATVVPAPTSGRR